MDAIECIKKRRSIRSYINRPIPKNIIEDIIDCARLAPSANNRQPWEFVVVTDKNRLMEIASHCIYGRFIAEAAACVIVLGDKNNHHAIEDCCIASTNIMLAARAYNIGSCWVAAWKKDLAKPVGKVINAPDTHEIISILPLGYYDKDIEPHHKKELKDVLHWERF